jgi:hypothetical protein
VNVKRVYRLYAEEDLAVRRRKRKRLVRDRALEPRLIRPARVRDCHNSTVLRAWKPLAVPNVRSLYPTRLFVDGLLSRFGVGSPNR